MLRRYRIGKTVAAFERLRPALLKQRAGQAAAIHRGQVVAVDDDKMAILAEVLAQSGPEAAFDFRMTPFTSVPTLADPV